MKITDSFSLVLHANGNITVKGNSDFEKLNNKQLMTAYEAFSKISINDRPSVIESVLKAATNSCQEESVTDSFVSTMKKIQKFFKDFNFSPSFRFLNTLARSKNSVYVADYFKLMNSPYADEVEEKIKSPEFKELFSEIKKIPLTRSINQRFCLYYGPQGTGKTTKALEESKGSCIICNGSMLPADIMEDFVFNDGKATFQWSEFAHAMMDGRTIVLDEINLLPFETLRFLQGLVDNKSSFVYKGKEVTIKDGFKIIGTMNLVVNGSVFGLPEPLVDRCEQIQEFTLKPEFMLKAF